MKFDIVDIQEKRRVFRCGATGQIPRFACQLHCPVTTFQYIVNRVKPVWSRGSAHDFVGGEQINYGGVVKACAKPFVITVRSCESQ
jgi:hypothetical protein